MGGTAHADVLIENNLIRDCGSRKRNGDDWDGINIKDQLQGVVLRRNVITGSLRSIQVTSSDLIIERNIIFDSSSPLMMRGCPALKRSFTARWMVGPWALACFRDAPERAERPGTPHSLSFVTVVSPATMSTSTELSSPASAFTSRST